MPRTQKLTVRSFFHLAFMPYRWEALGAWCNCRTSATWSSFGILFAEGIVLQRSFFCWRQRLRREITGIKRHSSVCFSRFIWSNWSSKMAKNNQACSEHDSDLEESARSLFLWNYRFWILGFLAATSIRPHSPEHKKPCVSCGQFEPGDVRWAYGVRKVPSKALRHYRTRLCLKVLCAKGVLFLCMAACCVWLYLHFLFFFGRCGAMWGGRPILHQT